MDNDSDAQRARGSYDETSDPLFNDPYLTNDHGNGAAACGRRAHVKTRSIPRAKSTKLNKPKQR